MPTEAKRDALATTEVIVRMISLILIPILIWVLGAWYNNQQKQMEEHRIMAENTANRLTYLLKNLSSDNWRERKMAVVISKYLAEQNQLPAELVQVLAGIAETDSSREVSDAAVLSLNAVSKSNNEQAPVAKAVLDELKSNKKLRLP
jgi:Tfp pilus assembly protein PilO